MTTPSTQDAVFMAQALTLAKRGLYSTDPNPRVGCVLVKADRIIAEGWHIKAGGAHAEVMALQALDSTVQAQGATAYVTLEPCSHFGKTPPCADALLAAGITRVVIAMQDPNPLVAGQGIARLQAHGIDVSVGLLQDQAEQLNRGFIKRMRTGLPWVTSKLAMSFDGRTAAANGESQWITSAAARLDVQRLRAQSSAVLTGINTALADDPALNVRDSIDNPLLADIPDISQPLRIVLDSNLHMPVTAKMAGLAGRSLILTGVDDPLRIQPLQQAGFEVYTLPLTNGRLDLPAVLVFLGQQQVNEVLIEAGALLNGALLEAALVDELIVYMSPTLLGDAGRGLFTLPHLQGLQQRQPLHWKDIRHVGADVRFTLGLGT